MSLRPEIWVITGRGEPMNGYELLKDEGLIIKPAASLGRADF